jgi:hypothetical protein
MAATELVRRIEMKVEVEERLGSGSHRNVL